MNNKPKIPNTEELLRDFSEGQPSHKVLYGDYLDSEEGQAVQNDDDSVDDDQE